MADKKNMTLDDILKEYNTKNAGSNAVKNNKQAVNDPKPVRMPDQPVNSVRRDTAVVKEAAQTPAPRPAAPVQAPVNKAAPTEKKRDDAPKNGRNSGHIDKRSSVKQKTEQYIFLFKQLVSRDFKSRYKRAVLGVLWSMLSPLLTFAAQAIIFSFLFARNQNHFISYLVIGNVVFHYFTDAANAGMFSLVANGSIISKINVPKSIFLFSKNVSCLFNFALTMIIMFIICAVDGVSFSLNYFALLFPIITLTIFNLGVGYLLSACFVFFKDTQYLFSLFTQILMYFSAIFYDLSRFPEELQKLFYVNPIFCYIDYFRTVIISNAIPDAKLHLLCGFYASIVFLLGLAVYKKYNGKFVYYF